MKNVLDRALKYLKYKKMKSILLIVLFFIVSSILLLSSTLNATIDNYYSQLDNKNGISVSVNPTMNMNSGQGKPSDIRNRFTNLSDEQLKKIEELDYVTDIMQSTSINVTSSNVEAISYDSSSNEDSSSDESNMMPGGNQRGGGMDISGLRILGSTHFNLEDDFKNETVSLSSGSMPSKDDEVVVSEALASENDLKVGSTFKVTSSNDTSKAKTYKVTGIYSYNSSLNEMAMQMVPENTMYATYSSVSGLVGSGQTRVTTQFFINSVDDFEQFKTDYFKITDTSSADYEVTLNDSVYKNTIEPLSQLAQIVDIAKWLILGVISGILAIVSYLMIKERNYEIGVLYSISESKKNIVMQFILENGIVLTIAFALAILFNKLLGSSIISSLMNMDLLNGVKEGAQRMGGPGNMMMPNNMGESSTTTIQAYIGLDGIVQAYIIILAVVIIITIITIAKTLLKRPKEIISD